MDLHEETEVDSDNSLPLMTNVSNNTNRPSDSTASSKCQRILTKILPVSISSPLLDSASSLAMDGALRDIHEMRRTVI